jgi:hypothetical protein
MRAVNQDQPSDADQAADFISKLDEVRFADFQKTLLNNQMLGVSNYPSTLLDGFDKATKFKVVQSSSGGGNRGLPSTTLNHVLVNASESSLNTKAKRGPGKKFETGMTPPTFDFNSESDEQGSSSSEAKKKPSKPCHICGEKHWLSDCPFLEDAKKYVDGKKKQLKDGEATTAVTFMDDGFVSSFNDLIL